MKPISLRSLLCLAGFILLALLPRAIRSFLRQSESQPPPQNVSGTDLSKIFSTTNTHTRLPNPLDKITMEPQLSFIRPKDSIIRIADAITGEIILTGPTSMIQNLEIRQFTLAPRTDGFYAYKFIKTQNGTWQQQRLHKQPASVEIVREHGSITIQFAWQPPRPEDQSVFKAALQGVDVTLTYLLDGQETRLVSRAIGVARQEREKASPPYSRN